MKEVTPKDHGRRVSDPLGGTSTYAYDTASRQTGTTDPMGRRSVTVYDVRGNAIATITGYGTLLQAAHAGGTFDAFVAKLTPAGTALAYATHRGGGGFDQTNGIAVDAAGAASVAGFTSSTYFPTATPLQTEFAGSIDAFVAKLSVPTGVAAVSVVPADAPTGPTRFTSLVDALQHVAPGGTVTSLPGATPDPALVYVGVRNVTIAGDGNVPGAILPRYDLLITAAGVTLQNLNLGTVTVPAGLDGLTIRRCSLGSLSTAGNGLVTLDQCQITGAVALRGNPIGESNFVVSNNTFTSFAGTLLRVDHSIGVVVRGNVLRGGGGRGSANQTGYARLNLFAGDPELYVGSAAGLGRCRCRLSPRRQRGVHADAVRRPLRPCREYFRTQRVDNAVRQPRGSGRSCRSCGTRPARGRPVPPLPGPHPGYERPAVLCELVAK